MKVLYRIIGRLRSDHASGHGVISGIPFFTFYLILFFKTKESSWWTVYVGRSTFEKISKVSKGQLKLDGTSWREQDQKLAWCISYKQGNTERKLGLANYCMFFMKCNTVRKATLGVMGQYAIRARIYSCVCYFVVGFTYPGWAKETKG